ncbi:MAG: hypothetical protein IJC46_08205 [Clostridia bacterium]|nr:hypothetical protein [Clostridia bacterium]
MNMKKLLALLMALMLVFTMAACSSDGETEKKDGEQTTTTTPNANAGTTTTPNTGVPTLPNSGSTTPNTGAPESDGELTVQQAIIGNWEGSMDIPVEDDIIDVEMMAEFTATTVKFTYTDEAIEEICMALGEDPDSEEFEAAVQLMKEEMENNSDMQGTYELSDDCVLTVNGEVLGGIIFDGPDSFNLYENVEDDSFGGSSVNFDRVA